MSSASRTGVGLLQLFLLSHNDDEDDDFKSRFVKCKLAPPKNDDIQFLVVFLFVSIFNASLC